MATTPILLLLGAGSNIGHHVARSFAEKGYKVALVARSLKEEDSTPDQINIPADLSDPASVAEVFSKVRARLGHPSVVVYNGRQIKLLKFPCVYKLTVPSCRPNTQQRNEPPLTLTGRLHPRHEHKHN